jgi:hypothetical protein
MVLKLATTVISVAVLISVSSSQAMADYKMQSAAACTATRPGGTDSQSFYYGAFFNTSDELGFLSCPVAEMSGFEAGMVQSLWISGSNGSEPIRASACSTTPEGVTTCGAETVGGVNVLSWLRVDDLSAWSADAFAFRYISIRHPASSRVFGYYYTY